MKRLLSWLLGGRLHYVLVASFSFVAALTVGLNALAVSQVVRDYLETAEADLVARDMDLANAFYQLKLDEVAAISYRLALDPWVSQGLAGAISGQPEAQALIDQQITNKITVLALGGTHLIAVLDADGNLVVGRVVSAQNELLPMISLGYLGDLPIVQEALRSGQPQAATEILPVEALAQAGLDGQALTPLVDTSRAAPAPFDPREGTAGLALIGAHPLVGMDGGVTGVVLSAHLLNNDFTLVDRIKEVAGVDTVTIFFGDLRVSTNVTTAEGNRAVGTRVSQDVFETVLQQGRDYVGRAYVVNEWFITRYEPLRDYRGQVVGSLYVGARESAFRALVQDVTNRVLIIALVSILLAGIVAVPVARVIIRPVAELVEANRRVARGDLGARVKPYGRGELALLGRTFNSMIEALQEAQQKLMRTLNNMAETLQETQQELLHKEKLASTGQLAAGVAHELNNPLGTILLYSNIVYKEIPEDDPHREDLQMVIGETNRCKIIVRNLLDFARQNEVLARPTNLNHLLRDLVSKWQQQVGFQAVEIVLDLDPEVPVIHADPLQLEQVLTNLAENAVEAMEHTVGGRLTLRTELAPLGQGVRLSVSDTGRGISEENRAKLFTPFFTTKPVGSGTGLGLAIVYGIVKMHGGQIQIQSEEGQGTAFTITLPFKPVGAASPPSVFGTI
ncbi:MAG: cache domain-containing protein [Anaerolineae bacterium]|nr:cache domain-containing protein [Anaerolineae bacterium]